MKIQLLCVGKTDIPYVNDGIEIYTSRLQHYFPFELAIIPEQKNWKKMNSEDRKKAEGEAILQKLLPTDRIILLDEKGRQHSSEGFAEQLQKEFSSGGKRLVFIIGGAFGFSNEVYDRVPNRLSLSKMTFSHQMVRLFLLEQVYRAMTIIKNEPYHNR